MTNYDRVAGFAGVNISDDDDVESGAPCFATSTFTEMEHMCLLALGTSCAVPTFHHDVFISIVMNVCAPGFAEAFEEDDIGMDDGDPSVPPVALAALLPAQLAALDALAGLHLHIYCQAASNFLLQLFFPCASPASPPPLPPFPPPPCAGCGASNMHSGSTRSSTRSARLSF